MDALGHRRLGNWGVRNMAIVALSRETGDLRPFTASGGAQGRPDPVAIVESLLRAKVMHDYFLYEKQGETRITWGCLGQVSVSADRVSLEWDGAPARSEPALDPFGQVESLLRSLPISGWTAYGYLAFDMAKYYYPYRRTINGPLLQFVIPRFELRITPGAVSILCVDEQGAADEAARIAGLINKAVREASPIPTSPALAFEDRQDYCKKVETLTSAIRDGALQKAILSRSARLPGTLDLLGTYDASSRVNNASRSYCFRMGDVGAVGFSPEILLEGDGRGLVTTNPLAGTRPRGTDEREDGRMLSELFTDAKEVKEHALSVLLVQEEMGSVCSPDTVRVYDFMNVKKFRCVQHLSTRVSGYLDPRRNLWDAIRALFPGVTVSGISKSAALQWISDMETEPRGIYGGGVGWVDSRGRADIAIAIRSAFQYGDTVLLNAGAGIVAESVPESEYTESVNKMNTMLSQIVLSRSQVA